MYWDRWDLYFCERCVILFRHMTEMKWRCLYGKTEKMQKSLHGTGLFKFRAGRHPLRGRVTLAVEEYEVIRLIDLEKLTHEQCAKQMDISRTTVTEIYESAREKIADCIVNGRPMEISGGSYRLCDGSAVHFCRKNAGGAQVRSRKERMRGKRERLRSAVRI